MKSLVRLDFVENISEDVWLNVAITESHIIDKQLDGSTIVDDYSHEHILRTMLTDHKGELINTTKEPGRVYIRVFDIDIPDSWNEDNVEVVAFVNKKDGTMDVFQSAKKTIK